MSDSAEGVPPHEENMVQLICDLMRKQPVARGAVEMKVREGNDLVNKGIRFPVHVMQEALNRVPKLPPPLPPPSDTPPDDPGAASSSGGAGHVPAVVVGDSPVDSGREIEPTGPLGVFEPPAAVAAVPNPALAGVVVRAPVPAAKSMPVPLADVVHVGGRPLLRTPDDSSQRDR